MHFEKLAFRMYHAFLVETEGPLPWKGRDPLFVERSGRGGPSVSTEFSLKQMGVAPSEGARPLCSLCFNQLLVETEGLHILGGGAPLCFNQTRVETEGPHMAAPPQRAWGLAVSIKFSLKKSGLASSEGVRPLCFNQIIGETEKPHRSPSKG